MKIAIYSPYLDTFGGGERYMMTIAEVYASGNTVDVLLDKHLENLGGDYLKNELSERFDLDLNTVNFINAPIGKNSSPVLRLCFLKKYDVFFCLTDGSIFYSTAGKNILHIQSPLVGETNNLWKKIKLSSWDLIIYNSGFTKEHSEKNWSIKSEVIYPPVDVEKIKKLRKKKYILSIGRFFGYLKDKKQSILIDVFKDLYKKNNLPGWSLHLVGSAGDGDKDYLEELAELAKDTPIKFYPNLGYDQLIKIYGESSIYWHAAGFEETDPTKMEHFGISTVEAMAAGCVPVVVSKGGQTEIVENGKNGFLWDSLKELKEYTILLINDQNLRSKLSQNAALTSQRFSKKRFEQKILDLVKT